MNHPNLHRIIYTSKVVPSLTMADISHIMALSLAANRQHGITGLLMFSSRHFAQWIEGESAPLQALYDNILRDHRHHGCALRDHSPIAQRQWRDWTMGVCLLDSDHACASDGAASVDADPSFWVDLSEEGADLARLCQRFEGVAKNLPQLVH